jgi:hypothetical protein
MCSALGHDAIYQQVNPHCHASLLVSVLIFPAISILYRKCLFAIVVFCYLLFGITFFGHHSSMICMNSENQVFMSHG